MKRTYNSPEIDICRFNSEEIMALGVGSSAEPEFLSIDCSEW